MQGYAGFPNYTVTRRRARTHDGDIDKPCTTLQDCLNTSGPMLCHPPFRYAPGTGVEVYSTINQWTVTPQFFRAVTIDFTPAFDFQTGRST